MHTNPNVQIVKPILKHINVIETLGYVEMIKLLSNVKFVISDSGGIQEEYACFRKKYLVCRNTTERPGWSCNNPYGKGNSSKKIVDSIIND